MSLAIGRGGHFTGHQTFFESPDDEDSKNAAQKLPKSSGDRLFCLATSPILGKKRLFGLLGKMGKMGIDMAGLPVGPGWHPPPVGSRRPAAHGDTQKVSQASQYPYPCQHLLQPAVQLSLRASTSIVKGRG